MLFIRALCKEPPRDPSKASCCPAAHVWGSHVWPRSQSRQAARQALESGHDGPVPPSTARFTQHRSGSTMVEAWLGNGSIGLFQPGLQPSGISALGPCGILSISAISQWRELSPSPHTVRGPWCAPTPTKGGLSSGLRVAHRGPGCFRAAQSCPAQLLFCFNKAAAAEPAQPPAHAVQHRLGSQLDA